MKQSPKRWRWLGPLGLMASVTILSGGEVAAFPPSPILGTDKIIHFLVFGLIATSIVRALPLEMPVLYRLLIPLVATSLFGISDEIHQSFTPNRTLDIYDWTADTLGALVASIAYLCWPRYRKVLEWRILSRRQDAVPRDGEPSECEQEAQPGS